MFQLWRDREKFQNVINIKSYLYAMVRNDAYRIVNKEKEKIALHEELTPDSDEDFDDKILEEEVYAILIEQLNQLPEGCKEIFELSVIEGLKYKEIASRLNISVNTVKSQRTRAIKLLKEKLKNHPFILFLLLIGSN